jgi:hypothetical protein
MACNIYHIRAMRENFFVLYGTTLSGSWLPTSWAQLERPACEVLRERCRFKIPSITMLLTGKDRYLPFANLLLLLSAFAPATSKFETPTFRLRTCSIENKSLPFQAGILPAMRGLSS